MRLEHGKLQIDRDIWIGYEILHERAVGEVTLTVTCWLTVFYLRLWLLFLVFYHVIK